MTALTFGTLKTAVLNTAHRPDLSADAPDFVRRAEGMIRRELRAYPLTKTLTDADRVTGGVYTLPTGLLEVRAIYASDVNANSYEVEQVGVRGIREELTVGAPVIQYAQRGTQIEFRGVPATGASLEMLYLGTPDAFAADGDTNDLLRDHEAVYLAGSLFYLYKQTEDLELAQGELDTFADAIEKLNQQYGRRLGGARPRAAYNFSPSGSY